MSVLAQLISNLLLLGILVGLAAYLLHRVQRIETRQDALAPLYVEQLQRQISAQQRDLHTLAEQLARLKAEAAVPQAGQAATLAEAQPPQPSDTSPHALAIR